MEKSSFTNDAHFFKVHVKQSGKSIRVVKLLGVLDASTSDDAEKAFTLTDTQKEA